MRKFILRTVGQLNVSCCIDDSSVNQWNFRNVYTVNIIELHNNKNVEKIDV